MKEVIISCNCGLGNRINNLVNLYFLQKVYKSSVKYFVCWKTNNHCRIGLEDLIDTRNTFEYPVTIIVDTKTQSFTGNTVMWASTDKWGSRWDNINYWAKYEIVMSVSFRFFRFCDVENTRIFLQKKIKWNSNINDVVDKNLKLYDINQNMHGLHYRLGDLYNLTNDFYADSEKSISTEHIFQVLNDIIAQYDRILVFGDCDVTRQILLRDNDNIVVRQTEHPVLIGKYEVERSKESICDACVDLVLLSKLKLVSYMPYSTFSVLAMLMNESCNHFHIDIHIYEQRPIIKKLL